MTKKMTKSQSRRMVRSIRMKAFKLLREDHISVKEFQTIGMALRKAETKLK